MPFSFSAFGKLIANLRNSPAAGAESTQLDTTQFVVGGGYNLGNAGGWSVSKGLNSQNNFARRGITQVIAGREDKHAIGDTAGVYTYNFGDGGVAAASDEGQTAITSHCDEYPGYFHGTVFSTTGMGDIAPVLTHTTGNGWTTDGGYLLDITKGTLLGTMTGTSTPLSLTINSGSVATFLNYLTVTGGTTPLPVSTAIGIATAPIANPATTRDNPIAVTLTVNLAQIASAYHLFTNGSVVTVAGNEYPEQSIVSGASILLAGNQQTITLHLCNPNSQAIIFQGGIQGQFISSDANLAFSGMRSAYFAFGSLLGTDMIYGNQVAGGVTNNLLPNAGCEAWTASGANSAWHLYPGAEVVANTDQGFACKVEQNGVVWATSDVVECTHFPTGGGHTACFTRSQYSPSNAGFGMEGLLLVLSGPGIGGGNTYGARIVNQQSAASYAGDGGPLTAPIGIAVQGVFGNLIAASAAPDAGAILLISNNNAAATDITQVINLNWNAAGNLTFTSSTGRWAISGAFDAQNGYFVNHVAGITHVLPVGKLTPTGTNGSITYVGGIPTSFVDPT